VEGSVRAKNKLDPSSRFYTTAANGGDKGGASVFLYCTMFGILLQPEAIFLLMFPQTLNGI